MAQAGTARDTRVPSAVGDDALWRFDRPDQAGARGADLGMADVMSDSLGLPGGPPPPGENTGAKAAHPNLRPPFPRGISGNPGGRPKHRLERLAREEAGQGVNLVQFWGKLFRGEPLPQKVIRLRPLRKDGQPYKVPYFVLEVPYYPTIEDRKWASERLAERGWGKPKQAHEVALDDGGEPRGFQIIYRRWPVGIDPLANQEQIIDGKGRVLPPGPV